MAQQRHQHDYSHILSLLPEDMLLHVLASGTQRHLFGSVTRCCKSWRDAVLRATRSVTVVLKSDAAAASAVLWLQRHGLTLEELDVTTAGLYSRHCDASTQLQLFKALHAAAGGPAVAVGAADDAQQQESCMSDADGSESEDDEGPAASAAAAAAAAGGGGGAAAEAAAAADGTQELENGQQSAAAAPAPATGATSAPSGTGTAPAGQLKPLRLRRLVANLRLAPADCAVIAGLPAPCLQALELHGSRTRRLTLDGVQSLARLTQLTCLCVQQLRIGDDAAALLAKHLTGLAVLELAGNNIGPAGAAAVAKHLPRLQRLDISTNRIKDAGLSAICSCLQGLQDLSIAGNVSFSTGTLQQLHHLSNLTNLRTSNNALHNAGLAAVAAALPQLSVLDAAGNKISKADPLTSMVCLTSLILSRNPLQISSTKVLAGLTTLQELVLFDAVSAKAVAALVGMAATLTSLTLGADPSFNPDGTKNLQLQKTRTCSMLFGGLADACKLKVLSAPCTGLGDAQAKTLGKLGGSLTTLNISYNCLSPAGLRCLRELQQLQRLEVRAMRPELSDEAAGELQGCSKLQLLDIAYNDLTSEGVKQLGSGRLPLVHLNLRGNVQVEKEAVIAAAPRLSCLTYLNLLELSDVSARGGAAAAPGHADVWSVLPNLQELVVGSEYGGSHASRSGRVMISCGG